MKVLNASVLTLALLSGTALLSAPAVAQSTDDSPHINLLADGPGKTQEEIEKAKEVEKAYKETLKKIPDASTTNDPWGSVRTEAQPKAKAKTKTGAAASHAKMAPAKRIVTQTSRN